MVIQAPPRVLGISTLQDLITVVNVERAAFGDAPATAQEVLQMIDDPGWGRGQERLQNTIDYVKKIEPDLISENMGPNFVKKLSLQLSLIHISEPTRPY